MAQEKIKRKNATRTKSENYLAFIRSLKLSGLGLDSASISVNRSALGGDEGNYGIELSAEFDVLDHQDTSAVIKGDFKVTITNTQTNANVGEILCVFSALFYLKKPATSADLHRFATVEGKLIFWPYLRHFVSDMSSRMSISPILIPLTSEFEEA